MILGDILCGKEKSHLVVVHGKTLFASYINLNGVDRRIEASYLVFIFLWPINKVLHSILIIKDCTKKKEKNCIKYANGASKF